MGGDEFVVAFADLGMEDAAKICWDIVNDISRGGYQIDTQSFTLSVSGGLVGTARFTESPLKEVISAADTLCRVAKKRSGERLVVMESGDQFFQQHKEELELISALERGETPAGLFLVMQPEISLTDPFDSLNFEVLLRLRKADGQVIPAGLIIEAAESHGKTAIIDRWVVTTTIDWLETHVASLGNTRFVGVNLSGGSLNDEVFTEELFQLFERHPVALSMICLEITETVALTDMKNMQRFIDRVRSIGAKVGLDDFGAGYSSFSYLKGLSVDALKLDGSLVRDAANSLPGMAIIEAIAGLVNSLGMKSIGEFAENLATIKALSAAGVDYAQGYGISKPVMPERILAARSGAEFIEDPAIMAFIRSLQDKSSHSMPLFEIQEQFSTG
jgi:EAL domain-containing protein (putative c-di-GMP-specific phosphodiesterase class I)